ncbi:hypothetical protein DF039_02090 [Burkholderia cenocepacia]|nr:hypothetical protein DF039_02090 [Burkholderia cenocepacia]
MHDASQSRRHPNIAIPITPVAATRTVIPLRRRTAGCHSTAIHPIANANRPRSASAVSTIN